MNTGDRVVFVVGPPRSGTTLVQGQITRMAGRKVVTVVETHFFSILLPLLRKCDGNWIEVRRVLKKHSVVFFDDAIGDTDLDRLVGEVKTGDDRSLFLMLVSILSSIEEGLLSDFVLLEKTPDHLFRLEEVFSVFPTAKVLICARDPASTIVSQRQYSEFWASGYRGLEHWIPRFRLAVNQITRWREDPRVLVSKHEDWISDRDALVNRIISWLEIEEDQGSDESSGYDRPTFIGKGEHWKLEAVSGRVVRATELRRVPRFSRFFIEAHLNGAGRELGYPEVNGLLSKVARRLTGTFLRKGILDRIV